VRARLRTHARSAAALAILIGLAAGVVLAVLSTAHRVETAYERLLTDIDAYDVAWPTCGAAPCTTEETQRELEASGLVEFTTIGVAFLLPALTTADGRGVSVDPVSPCGTGNHEIAIWSAPEGWGPTGGVPMRVEDGRPFATDGVEILLPRIIADRVGVAVGDTLLLTGPCADDEPAPWSEPLPLTVAGIGVGPFDVDAPTVDFTAENIIASPGVMREIDRRGWSADSRSEGIAVWRATGVTDEQLEALAPDTAGLFAVPPRADQMRAGLEPDAAALRLLALLSAAAGALVIAPLIARHLRAVAREDDVTRALGATRALRAAYGLAYACVLGCGAAFVAIVVALLVSPFIPRGLAETVEAHPGISIERGVLLVGGPVIVVMTMLIAAVPAWRATATRPMARARGSSIAGRIAHTLRLGPAGAIGLQSALERGARDRAVPALQGTIALAIAVGCVAGAQTFSQGLTELKETPRLMGWGWDALVFLEDGPSLDALAATPGIERVTGGTLWYPFEEATSLAFERRAAPVVPRAFATGPDAITPVVTRGRAAREPDEIVLPRALARKLDIDIGDTITLGVPDPVRILAAQHGIDTDQSSAEERRLEFEVVGVGTLVPFGSSAAIVAVTFEGLTRMVTPTADELDALAANLDEDAATAVRAIDPSTSAQPQVAYIDVDGGYDRAAALFDPLENDNVIVVERGQEIIDSFALLDLSRANRVPDALGGLFVVVAIGVIAILVAGGLNARRRDLAVLRSLGLSRRGVCGATMWQAGVQTLIPLAIGIPLGVVVGRVVWTAYATDLGVVPEGAVWLPGLVVLACAALVLAIAVALVLTTAALRHHPIESLRAE
jgi:hypothetical protein